jgi:hypothetical protein
MSVRYTQEQDDIIRAMVAEGKSSTAAGKVLGRGQTAMVRRAHRLGIAFHAKGGPPKSNIIKFPKRKYVRRASAAAKQADAPKLRVVSNNIPLMVQDWLDRNGGPRRFEKNATADTWAIRAYLEERGIRMNGHQCKWSVSTGRGRPRTMKWSEIVRIADEFRIAEGLQPFVNYG